MLIHSNDMQIEQLLTEKLNVLYEEMMVFYRQYGPDKENLEDDDEATLMMGVIGIFKPFTLENRFDAIKLLAYFLSEYCWIEDPASEEVKQQLLSRAQELLPKEKRKRQKILQWLKRIH